MQLMRSRNSWMDIIQAGQRECQVGGGSGIGTGNGTCVPPGPPVCRWPPVSGPGCRVSGLGSQVSGGRYPGRGTEDRGRGTHGRGIAYDRMGTHDVPWPVPVSGWGLGSGLRSSDPGWRTEGGYLFTHGDIWRPSGHPGLSHICDVYAKNMSRFRDPKNGFHHGYPESLVHDVLFHHGNVENPGAWHENCSLTFLNSGARECGPGDPIIGIPRIATRYNIATGRR